MKKEIRLKLESKGIDTTEVDLSDNLSEYELESRLVKDLDRRGYLSCCHQVEVRHRHSFFGNSGVVCINFAFSFLV